MKQIWRVLRSEPTAIFGWMPRTLEQLSTETSSLLAFLIGTLSLVAQTAIPWAICCGSLSEPYPSLGVFFSEGVRVAPMATMFLTVFWGVLVGCVYLATSARQRNQRLVAAACASPVSTIVPGVIWSVFAALGVLAAPGNDLNPPAVKPAWLVSGVFDILGCPLWGLLGLGLIFFNWRVACARIDASAPSNACQNCDYNLTGNSSGVCPECETPLEPIPR